MVAVDQFYFGLVLVFGVLDLATSVSHDEAYGKTIFTDYLQLI